VLVHGYSRVVLALLRRVQASANNFSVVVTEGRPDGTGVSMAKALAEMGIPATLILDAAVAYVMERCAPPSFSFLSSAPARGRGARGGVRKAGSSARRARSPPFGTHTHTLLSLPRSHTPLSHPFQRAASTWCSWARRGWWRTAA